ncbi:MAG: phenylalanine--tRNA ligase subunit beta [Dictyoglomus thermophilum]|uniref:Phenylalanine--tRNA ligase beta subunit n=1 Tax=Dictyoglomus thermophilum TaxID=14 RepID=A0A7V3ZJ36_DICTH|nr:phenylalanine--tRNA ligase subunit beta [Dictyoglomus thermophilum]MCX7719721.1 phenylalanine--tRNA ligase subunit beta [Dictyoglomus thermophilum]TYT21155.1 phenylalanine--tRNA ligase subunit beta [Dictyoglomus thermophilum]
MLVSYRWLMDYLEEEIPVKEVINALRNLGLYGTIQKSIGANWDKIIIGEIKSIEKHPHSENLLICKVDVGEKLLNIVTGAKNVFVGAKVPVALPGVEILGEVIGIREFNGIKSEGMLCSEYELEFSEDKEGIMILPEDFKIGSTFDTYFGKGDFLIDVEVPSNRGDCLSYLGIAREISGYFGVPLKFEFKKAQEKDDISIKDFASCEVLDFDLCPRFTLRFIKDVKIGPSPLWLRWRLERVGLRSINNVVDITNFIMLETGQPLHAYDFDLLKGGKLIVRRAKEGEKIVLINGEEKILDNDILVIADAERAVGIGGIMGGKDTEINDNTKNVLLEAAYFSPVNIRRSARKLGIRTDASLRFERNVDIHRTADILDYAAEMIRLVAGGDIAKDKIDINKGLPSLTKVFLRPERVNKILGTNLKEDEIVRILSKIGFDIKSRNPVLEIEVPSYRQDIKEEIDLIEEVARFYGYNNIPSVPLQKGHIVDPPLTEEIIERRIRETLPSLGLYEAINYSFMSVKDLEKAGILNTEPFNLFIQISNPLSEENSVLRTSLLPSLLNVAQVNSNRQQKDVFVYEIGKVFYKGKDEYIEEKHLGILMTGEAYKDPWSVPYEIRKVDFYDLKGIVETIFERIWKEEPTFKKSNFEFMHPSKQSYIAFRDEIVGFMGEVNPWITQNLDIRERVYFVEINLDKLNFESPKPKYKPLPIYPGIRRDLALIIPEDMPVENVEKDIIETSGELLKWLRIFDLYQGEKIEKGYKSITFSLFFLAEDHTLEDKEVDEIINKVLIKLSEKGVYLRQK